MPRGRKKAARNAKLQEDSRGAASSSAQVSVETLEKGFRINVFLERNSPGLLVRILEAFEELGLEVLDASVSCSDCFQLEAVGGENQERNENIDEEVVRQAVFQAINKWSEDEDQK